MLRLATGIFAVCLMALPALGQNINCSDFRYNGDESWSPIKEITFTSPLGHISVGPGASFRPGVQFSDGVDLATLLNRQCPLMRLGK
jgi:hypothetical protein